MKNLIYFLIAVLLIGVIFGFTLSDEKNTSNNTENTSLTITEPGNYDVSKYDEIIVDIDTSTEINLQDKTVTPGESIQTITPDLNYNGLGSVTINPIPDHYIKPDGSIEITENGTYNVKNLESVNINIPITSYTEWDGSYQEISNVEKLQDSGVPEGYRLLTSEDEGKTFGVDLESKIYIDSSVTPNTFTSASDYIPLVIFENTNLEIFINDPMDSERSVGIFAFSTYNGGTPTDGYPLYSDSSGVWTSSNVDLVNNLELTYTIKEVYFGGTFSGSNIEVEENTWLYVKDYIPDPYTITIKNKNGIELLTKDQLLTDTVKIKVDESLLGGESSGGSGGGVDLDYNITIKICSNSGTFGTGFEYSLDYGKTWEYIVPTGDPDEQYTYSATIYANKGFQSSGDNIQTEKFACILLRFSTSQASVGVSSNAGYIKLYGNNSYQVYLITTDSYAEVEVTLSPSGGAS